MLTDFKLAQLAWLAQALTSARVDSGWGQFFILY